MTDFETVQEEWMLDLPLKMQSTLLACIRGVDSQWAPGTKSLNRWLRSLMLKNGNSANDHSDFQKLKPLPLFDGDFEREIEYLPVHYFHHLILGLGIVHYKHPEKDVADIAGYYYTGMVEMLHQTPETERHMDWRLMDNPGELRDPPPVVPAALDAHNTKFNPAPPAPPPPAPSNTSYRRSGY